MLRLLFCTLVGVLLCTAVAFAQAESPWDHDHQPDAEQLACPTTTCGRLFGEPGGFCYLVPTVIHVLIHKDYEGEDVEEDIILNPSDEDVEATFNSIRKRFRGQNEGIASVSSTFCSVIGDSKIDFFLAEEIDQVYLDDLSGLSEGDFFKLVEVAPKASGTEEYLHIWIVADSDIHAGLASSLDPDFRSSSTPGGLDSPTGIVLSSSFALTNDGQTLTHEIGHFFGLRHIWGNLSEPKFKCDDQIDDTPFQSSGDGKICDNLCGTSYNLRPINSECYDEQLRRRQLSPGTTIATSHPFVNTQNYMSYSSCREMFTQGQCNWMAKTIEAYGNGVFSQVDNIQYCKYTRDPRNPWASDNRAATDNDTGNAYPNPFTNTISIGNISFGSQVEILSTEAKRYKSINQIKTNVLELDLSDLPTGVYFLRIKDPQGNVKVNKIIKSR